MRFRNCIFNKTLIVSPDGSYSFCNLNNCNKSAYYDMFILKMNLKTSPIEKKLNNKLNDTKLKSFYSNIKKKF